MTWRIKYLSSVIKSVKKIDPKSRVRIRKYLEDRVAVLDDPRRLGKPLKGNLKELWCYRIGDYRVICDLQDQFLVVLVVHIGHRKDIYR